MQKILVCLLALAMVFSLAACGGDADVSSPVSDDNQTTTTTTTTAATATTTTTQATTTTEVVSDTTTTKDTTTIKDTTTGKTDTTTKAPTTEDKTTTTTTTTEESTTQEKTTATTTSTKKTTSRTSRSTTSRTSRSTTTTTKAAGIKTVCGSSKNEKTWVYEIVETGLHVRETTIDSGKGGEPVEIVQISDLHFNAINDKDRQENNPTIMGANGAQGMYQYRVNLKDGAILPTAKRCLEYAKQYDQTVVTGDSIDYLTWGAIEMVKDVIWGTIPSALVTLGNHDMTRDWTEANIAGVPKDETTMESRYQILQDNWKHDVYYTSKVVGNKAMVIQMDNGSGTFWASQAPKLKADVEKARKNGYVVLLFTHIAISNNNPSQAGAKVIRKTPGGTPGVSAYKPAGLNETPETKAIYDIVYNNADVIRGVFSGHSHCDVYYDISAKTPDGKDQTIPQIILTSVQYNSGTVMKITVK